jgi:hypothetical protein
MPPFHGVKSCRGGDRGPSGGNPWISLTESTPQPVPEPSMILLLGAGLLNLAGFRNKMKR